MGSEVTTLPTYRPFHLPETYKASTSLVPVLTFFQTIDFALNDPKNFTYECLKITTTNSHTFITVHTPPFIEEIFNRSLSEDLFSTGSYCFTISKASIPYILDILNISKLALEIMFLDLFDSFIYPFEKNLQNQEIPVQSGVALGVIGATLLAHKLALTRLKEDPKLATSITYGSLTGIFTSFIMNQDLCIGALSGALIGVITDTAFCAISRNRILNFFKHQYKKSKLRKSIQEFQKFTIQVSPYLFFTCGTAIIYSNIRPIILKHMQEIDAPSKKLLIIKVIAVSGLLFGIGKSYLTPITQSLWSHAKTVVQSAHTTSTLFAWTPRVLTILTITSLFNKKIKN